MARCGIDLPAQQTDRLDRYCRLLWQWNAQINLTRHTNYDRFVARDLVDSLVIAEFLRTGEKILDVGTGGGVPGVVLAVVREDLNVTVCESVGKKARAVADIVAQLRLPVRAVHARAEQLVAEESFDTLVIRAVARLSKLLVWFHPWWDRFERMLVLKGPRWVEERGEARHRGLMRELSLRKLKRYGCQQFDAGGVLLQISRKQAAG